MKFNIKLYLKTIWFSFFKSEGTPGRMTPKRFFVLMFIFLLYPLWHFSIWLAYSLDKVFYPELQNQNIEQPVFIVGNFRSGTTLLHRLLAKDDRFTGMKTWEIYLAPSILQRKFYHWVLKINRFIGNPIQKIINAFEKTLKKYAYIHPSGLNKIEEDGHIFLHLFSTYNLFAFFPFPELVRNYIYYDDEVPDSQKEEEMSYYQGVLKRHIYSNQGKRYISKSPTYSAKVRTLHKQFPDAKFINLVRSPLRVIPSSVSMFSKHWKIYGEPEEEYPQTAPEVICEQAKYWYIYPHQYLKTLPSDQYVMVRYQDLTTDPKATIENIYKRLGIEMTQEYRQKLSEESEKAKKFKSHHHYSLKQMGLNDKQLKKEFASAIKEYEMDKKSAL
jgi:hypothetical protein